MTDGGYLLLNLVGLAALVVALAPPVRWRWRLVALALAVGCGWGLVAMGRTTGLQQLLNGIFLGSIYALIALGYTMVYGVLKLINFAHGEIFMVGAFIGYFTLTALAPLPVVALVMALLLAMLVCAGLGVVIERAAYRPLRNAPRLAALITAIGVSLLLQNLGLLVVGAQPKTMPGILPTQSIPAIKEYLGLQVSVPNLVTVAAAVILMLGLNLIVSRTKIGRAMRAVSEDREAARLMGINVDLVITATFIIGSALAGAGGVLYGIRYPSIKPDLGILPGLKAFVAAVLGGIGSIKGAMIGGLLIGIVEVVVQATTASPYRLWQAAFALVLVLAVGRGVAPRLRDWLPDPKRRTALGTAGMVFGSWLAIGVGALLARQVAPLLCQEPFRASVTGSTFRDAVVFVILIVLLIVKPTGLMGRYAPEKV